MLSIIVLTILALSLAAPFVSVNAVLGSPIVDDYTVQVEDIITVSGSGVISGSTVSAYWDIAQGPDAILLNTTTGGSDGTFEMDIEVPPSVNGSHWVWVNSGTSYENTSAITVSPKLEVDPDSGLPDDTVTLSGTGFVGEVGFNASIWNNAPASYDSLVTGNAEETDEYGSFSIEIDIPSGLAYDLGYVINVTHGLGNITVGFTVGAAITLTPDEGPEGTVIQVSGRGFDPSVTLSLGNVTWDGTYSMPIVGDTATTDSNGEFTLEVVAPSWGEGPWSIEVDDVNNQDSSDFDIDGVATVEVSPTYGSPGATITLNGYNFTQIAGTEILLELNGGAANLGTVDTNADGTFETTFVSPAVTFGTYQVWANDTTYGVNASDAFKVGIIALIINPTYGEAGQGVGVTGIGFSDGLYNLTFGDELYEDFGTVSGEAISDTFYVPNVEPGTYELNIIDTEENELNAVFTVTESTSVSMDPVLAPNEYNVSIEGYNFADSVGDVDFVIYNSTAEWDMDVWEDGAGSVSAATDIDGNFTGWWMVLVEDTLEIGDYTVNVTGTEGLLVQVPFSVVAARVDVAPRKALFDRGDSIQFDINNDFKLPDSYIEIYSPGDTLYWSTEPFDTTWWMQVEGLYTVPYYRQTDAVGNPMELQNDAPMGTWLYIFYDFEDTQLMNGTFEVGPSTTAQIDAMLENVQSDLSVLSDDVYDLGGEFDALSDEIGDVASDVDGLKDEIVGDLADDIAAATAAGNAASDAVEDLEDSLSDLEDSMGDIADASNSALDAAQEAADAAADAATAAEGAGDAAKGLTSLVYGAIGASLIAALAAIVSLMQISKKIAG